MRRLLIITLTLCTLTLAASAWAGPGHNHMPAPGYSQHQVKGPGWGHKTVHRHTQWDRRPGHRYGQRRHHRAYVAQRCAPVPRRPVVVKERHIDRRAVQEYTITIRTFN